MDGMKADETVNRLKTFGPEMSKSHFPLLVPRPRDGTLRILVLYWNFGGNWELDHDHEHEHELMIVRQC